MEISFLPTRIITMKIPILFEAKKYLCLFLFALNMIYWVEPDIHEGVIAINPLIFMLQKL